MGQLYLQLQWRPADLKALDRKEPKNLLDMQSVQQERKTVPAVVVP